MQYTRFEKARIIGARALQISMGAPSLIKTTNPLLFGKISHDDYGTDGKIDDIRIYNYVLSEDEIEDLYNE